MSFRRILRSAVRQHAFRHYKRLVSGVEFKAYHEGTGSPKLNLGCGSNKVAGWFNTDLYPGIGAAHLDFSRPFPFPDGTFDAILCEHTIEHVPKALAMAMARETYRVLKKGGSFRVVTPGFDLLAEYVLQPETAAAKHFLILSRAIGCNEDMSLIDAVNDMFYKHGHQYLYDRKELAALLEMAGFSEINQLCMGDKGFPVFDGADGHSKVIGHEYNALHSIAVEARK